MARTLSSAIQGLIAKDTSSVVHLLRFTVGATTYRFAEDQVEFQSFTYLPRLMLSAAARYSQKLRTGPLTVELQNITLETAAILKAEKSAAQGVEATVLRLYLKANEGLTLYVGRIGQMQVDEQRATLTLEGDLDPTASQVPQRKYSSLCVWDFKDADCGYVDNVDPDDPATGLPFTQCPKDFASCLARSREERFPGFIHVTRDLTEAVEGQVPDDEEDDVMDDFYDDEE